MVDRGGPDQDPYDGAVAGRDGGLQTGHDGVLEAALGERREGGDVDGAGRGGDVGGRFRQQRTGAGPVGAGGVAPAAGRLEQPVGRVGGVPGAGQAVALGALPHGALQSGGHLPQDALDGVEVGGVRGRRCSGRRVGGRGGHDGEQGGGRGGGEGGAQRATGAAGAGSGHVMFLQSMAGGSWFTRRSPQDYPEVTSNPICTCQ